MRIKELRNSLEISLKSLSARLRIDRAYLSRVEAGKVPPSDGLISRLADVLNYDRDELSLLAGRIPETLMKEVYKNTKTIVLNFPCESDYPLQRGSTPHIMPVELCL